MKHKFPRIEIGIRENSFPFFSIRGQSSFDLMQMKKMGMNDANWLGPTPQI
jgi:hypothetical protein